MPNKEYMSIVLFNEKRSYFRQEGSISSYKESVYRVNRLPFFLGDKTPFLDFVDLPFFNALDTAVNGMCLSLELLPIQSQSLSNSKLPDKSWESFTSSTTPK